MEPTTATNAASFRPRRKLSYPAAFVTTIIGDAPLSSSSSSGRRRFSNVGEAVTRKLSTIAWRHPPEEIVAVGKTLCSLYIRNRLKRANLLSKKHQLMAAGTGGAAAAATAPHNVRVRDVFPGLVCACSEMERMHPRLFSNVARQAGVVDGTGGGGALLALIGHQVLRNDLTWGKIVAVFSVAGGLAIDCVQQGHAEHIHELIDSMVELLEDRIALWVAGNGGWAGLTSYCRREDQDISLVEYLAIFALVLTILLVVYTVVRFFIKFTMF